MSTRSDHLKQAAIAQSIDGALPHGRFTRRQLVKLAGAASAAALIGTWRTDTANGQRAPKRVLKLGHVNATTSHVHLAALKFAEAVAAKTHYEVAVQVFPISQLGGNVQMIEAVRTGTQDLVFPSAAETENTVKEWTIFDLPYLFDGVDEANKILQGAIGRRFLDMLPRFNMYGLGWVSTVDRDIMSRTKPIRMVADLQGFKIRVLPAPGYVETYKALGANPTPLPYSQLYLALQQGTVDGADTSPDQAMQDKFVEVIKYFSLNEMQFIPIAMIMSKQTMDSLPSDWQQAIREAAKEATKVSLASYHRFVQLALVDMKRRGIDVIQVDKRPWREVTKAVRDKLAGAIPDGRQNLELILNAAKKAG